MLFKGTARSSEQILTAVELYLCCFSVCEYGGQLCASVQISAEKKVAQQLSFSKRTSRGSSSFEMLMFYSIRFHFVHCQSQIVCVQRGEIGPNISQMTF